MSARIRNVQHEHQQSLSRNEHAGLWVANHVGAMGFFYIIFAWTVAWLGWNAVGPPRYRFDPAPTFLTWLFVSNVLQIHLMPLIMVGQNTQQRFTDLRAEKQHLVDMQADSEIEQILALLNEMRPHIYAIRAVLTTAAAKTEDKPIKSRRVKKGATDEA